MKKTVIAVTALILIACCAVGSTLAWLIDRTEKVVNTFTVGDINITLTETAREYKMIPGNTIDKDPTVTVEKNSEACWLFVKIEKSANFDTFMTFEVADGWTALTGVDGVYYREVASSATDSAFSVLKDDAVKVKGEVTKAQLGALTDNTKPTLTFTAYAVQKDNIATAAAAWAKL